jgi:TatD DNase family protein
MSVLIDTHAHINDERLAGEAADIIQRARCNSVMYIINASEDVDSSAVALKQARRFSEVFSAAGIHPHHADEVNHDTLEQIEELAGDPRVVAIGEIGLDYYYDSPPRDLQKQAFQDQIKLAKQLGLPIIVHDREAHADTLSILQSEAGTDLRGVMHCYSGSAEMVEDFVDLGFYISFAGTVTFNKARKPKEAAAAVPLERLLVETDCPYLAPEPYRGKRNEPAYVMYTAMCIAELRQMPFRALADVTTENAVRLFSLPV